MFLNIKSYLLSGDIYKIMNYVIKVFLIAILIVAINEIAKLNVTLGALIKALPLISIISFIWLYYGSSHGTDIVARFSTDTFWLVLPTLPLFPIFTYLLKQTKCGFWGSLSLSIFVMILCYLALIKVLEIGGIKL